MLIAKLTAYQSLLKKPLIGKVHSSVINPCQYDLQVCTSNLGSNSQKNGHKTLKHCHAELKDGNQTLKTWSIGLNGVSEAPYSHHASTQCMTQATSIDKDGVIQFENALYQCMGQGYLWGKRDCCSCIEAAIRSGLKQQPEALISQAAQDLSQSPDLSGKMLS